MKSFFIVPLERPANSGKMLASNCLCGGFAAPLNITEAKNCETILIKSFTLILIISDQVYRRQVKKQSQA
jgi:hypothetical protein